MLTPLCPAIISFEKRVSRLFSLSIFLDTLPLNPVLQVLRVKPWSWPTFTLLPSQPPSDSSPYLTVLSLPRAPLALIPFEGSSCFRPPHIANRGPVLCSVPSGLKQHRALEFSSWKASRDNFDGLILVQCRIEDIQEYLILLHFTLLCFADIGGGCFVLTNWRFVAIPQRARLWVPFFQQRLLTSCLCVIFW